MDLETSSKDMTAMVHLDALKLEDRSRPDDSPFRYVNQDFLRGGV